MSVNIPECWDEVVGITRRDCECLTYDTVPVGYDVALSGLYLDELKGIDLFKVNDSGAECGDLWEKIITAKDNAINTLKIDLATELLKYNRLKYRTFSGMLGASRWNNTLTLTGTFAGVRLFCRDIKSGKIILKSITGYFNTAQPINGYVYCNSPDIPTLIDTFSFVPVAGKATVYTFQAPLELPMQDEYFENLEYYIIYESAGVTPKNNGLTCGCGGVKWCFNTENYCFAQPGANKDAWRQFVMAGGIQGSDLSIINDWSIYQQSNGLVLGLEIYCSTDDLFCNEYSNWTTDTVDMAIAQALRYKWGEFTMDFVLDSTEINRFTMLDKDGLLANREYYNSRYTVMVDFIAKSYDITRSGCLACDHPYNMQRRGVLS